MIRRNKRSGKAAEWNNQLEHAANDGGRALCLYAVLAMVVLCVVQSAVAQSGRKKTAGVPVVTPVTSSDTANSQPTTASRLKITSMVVSGQILHSYLYSKFSFLESALKDCVNTLRSRHVDAE